MRTYRNVIITKGYDDKVTTLQRGGSLMWTDDDGDFASRDLPSSSTKVEQTYADAILYFQANGYRSHFGGTGWKMLCKDTGTT